MWVGCRQGKHPSGVLLLRSWTVFGVRPVGFWAKSLELELQQVLGSHNRATPSTALQSLSYPTA